MAKEIHCWQHYLEPNFTCRLLKSGNFTEMYIANNLQGRGRESLPDIFNAFEKDFDVKIVNIVPLEIPSRFLLIHTEAKAL